MSEGDVRARALWWSAIRPLGEADAKAALLQAIADMEHHWRLEHADEPPPEDLGIPPDEYVTSLIDRVRRQPPPETLE